MRLRRLQPNPEWSIETSHVSATTVARCTACDWSDYTPDADIECDQHAVTTGHVVRYTATATTLNARIRKDRN